MKERGILFSAPMVDALLSGAKTQTRRALKRQPSAAVEHNGWPVEVARLADDSWGLCHGGVVHEGLGRCPYGLAGDHLWVKETFRKPMNDGDRCEYAASIPADTYRLTPSIFMPRWASRITLEITDVRVERLNEISEDDAIAEGAHRKIWITSPISAGAMGARGDRGTHREGYKEIWEDINGDGSWALNPWIWKIEFKRIAP